MAEEFSRISKTTVPISLFGQTALGHADILDMGNHVKVNIRFNKDVPEVVQLLAEGLVGLSVEYSSAEALYKQQEAINAASTKVSETPNCD